MEACLTLTCQSYGCNDIILAAAVWELKSSATYPLGTNTVVLVLPDTQV